MRGDSPRGGEMSRSDRGDGALFALDAERPEGWFPVQSLKINRARPVKRADGEHRPLQMVFMFAARGGWAAIIRPVKRGVGDAAPYMQGEVYYNFVVCNAVRPYRLFYCYSLP